jgi:hypothetical protein
VRKGRTGGGWVDWAVTRKQGGLAKKVNLKSFYGR